MNTASSPISPSACVRVGVIGAGSWGTALAQHLASSGHLVTLWGRDRAALAEIATAHTHTRYFPGETLSSSLQVCEDLTQVVASSDIVVMAVPAQAVREVAKQVAPHLKAGPVPVVSTAKGLEMTTLSRMSEVLEEELGERSRITVLSGPSFALEVVRGLPTAVVLAGSDEGVCNQVAKCFHRGLLRVYTSGDVVGVELGGTLKNIYAIAAGIVDGSNLGANGRAALLTRSVTEMTRFIVALGGSPETAAGLSGLGDLLLTATGELSRNRRLGIRLAQGESAEEIVASLGQVAEGFTTTQAVRDLARSLKLSAPIVDEVAKILSGESSVERSLAHLLSRDMRPE